MSTTASDHRTKDLVTLADFYRCDLSPSDRAEIVAEFRRRDEDYRRLVEAGERVVYDLPNNHRSLVFSRLLARARELSTG